MSDESEREIQTLGIALLTVYTLISRVCELLPIPITLPDFDGDVLHGPEMISAVTRVTELVEDEPISEDLQAGLWGGCLHWLSAAHLFSRFMQTGEHVVSLEIRINLVTGADALHIVAHQLTGNQDE
jgi:hypothetical protein